MNEWFNVGQVGKQRQQLQQHEQHEQPGPTADADGKPDGPAATFEQQHAGGVEGKEQLQSEPGER